MRYTGIYIIMLVSLAAFGQETFTNPILPSGADPWVTWKDGYYYYTNTVGNRIILYKTEKLHELKKETPKTVWTPPATGPNSKAIWAPELHYLDGKWYLYYTATDVNNDGDASRYIFVLENTYGDP